MIMTHAHTVDIVLPCTYVYVPEEREKRLRSNRPQCKISIKQTMTYRDDYSPPPFVIAISV